MAQAIKSREPVTGTAVTTKKRKKFFLLDLYSTAVGKKNFLRFFMVTAVPVTGSRDWIACAIA